MTSRSHMMPLVSIIIPTYNRADLLPLTVDCCLAQTYPEIEIIVVDDGSTDNTVQVMERYKDRVRLICKPNGGVSTARNAGYEASAGTYLLFLDSDDLIPPQKIDVLVRAMEAHPTWGMVYSAWQCVDATGQQVLSEVRVRKQGRVLADLLLRTIPVTPSCVLIRRSCLEEVGLFDPQLAGPEDIDMWIRIAHAGYEIGYVDQFLLQYRILNNSLSRNIDKMVQDDLHLLDKYFARDDVPPDIRRLEAQARAVVYYNAAVRYFYTGRIAQGQQCIREAMRLCPELSNDKNWLLMWLGGYANDAEVQAPEQMLAAVMDNLPPEATTLRSLRRAAFGSYHVAALFTAYENNRLDDVWPHIWPAIRDYPEILLNRGFLSICAQSVKKRLLRGVDSSLAASTARGAKSL